MSASKYKIQAKNPIFTIYKIPFKDIERANVSLKDKNKTYSLEKHCKEQSWDIGINGVFFDMKSYQNVCDLIVKGVVNNGGNYSNIGIAFGNDFPNIGAYKSTTANSKGKAVDFFGGTPTLIVDGKINMDAKGLGSSFVKDSVLTRRTAVGIDKSNIYVISTLRNKTNLKSVANELLAQGCINAVGMDGGGSTSLYADNKVVYTQGRNIPTAFGIKLKNISPTPSPTKKPKVAIDSGHHAKTAGKMSVDGTLKEYEFNMDISKRVQSHLTRHGVESKIFQSTNSNLKQELLERIAWNDAYKPDISLSVHSNAFGDGKTWNDANGWEVFYSTGSVNGKRLAECIHSTSIPFLGLTDRGVKDTRTLAMVRRPYAPSVLIEHGFMTNKVECELLKSDDFRNKCAIADAKGILKYFSIPWIEPKVEVKPVTKPETDILYKVQVGAFGNKENAEKLQDTLESLGYDTIIKEEKRDK
ncbi:MAG: N-acetylmuramoyl-L-alanine amidase [Candidatus Pacebacteria bacterium]|nr:N-acetylmuramoyl-L-alanine amidase [Candidatus Paceibacterota bacterium]